MGGIGRLGLTYIYILLVLCINEITTENLLYSTGNFTECSDLIGKEIQKRGDSGINIADSLCCTAETNAGEGNGNPLQCSCLENPMGGGAWEATVHGVAQSWTRLSNFTFTFHFCALEKEKATHSSVLAWRIPGTGKPGGLLSVGSHRVGHY